MATYLKCSQLRSERRWWLSRHFLLWSKTSNLLCPVRALRIYIERSVPFRQSEQLCVCFGSCTKGSPVTKQRLSRWIIDAMTLWAPGTERALERTVWAPGTERTAWGSWNGAGALERTLWAHGTERALERTLWAHGTERSLVRTLWAHGTEWALERTLWFDGTERALKRTLWAHGTQRAPPPRELCERAPPPREICEQTPAFGSSVSGHRRVGSFVRGLRRLRGLVSGLRSWLRSWLHPEGRATQMQSQVEVVLQQLQLQYSILDIKGSARHPQKKNRRQVFSVADWRATFQKCRAYSSTLPSPWRMLMCFPAGPCLLVRFCHGTVREGTEEEQRSGSKCR